MRSCRFPNRDGTSDEMPPHVLHRRDEWRVIYSILLPSFTAAISYVARLETDNKNEGRPSLIDGRGLHIGSTRVRFALSPGYLGVPCLLASLRFASSPGFGPAAT